MERCFPKPSLVCYKRHKNLKDMLIRAKVSLNRRPQRNQLGFKKCRFVGKECVMCKGSNMRITAHKCSRTGKTWNITSALNCDTRNVIYKLWCRRCAHWVYIGETERRAKDRFYEHRSCVTQKKLDTPAGKHFNLPKHKKSDMGMVPFERVRPSNNPDVRKIREKLWIARYDAVTFGANRKK